MGNLVLNGATSGSTTVVPTDATTATLTLPASTGTLLSTANPQSGGVIQTQATNLFGNGAYFSTTTAGTYQATGHSVTITPKFSTSKILILCSGSLWSASSGAYLTIYRNSTDLSQTGGGNNAALAIIYRSDGGSSATLASAGNVNFLDSPATTSALTYQVYIQSQTAGQTVYWGADPAWLNKYNISLTVMEIAA
jgi:hypothetical protein